MKRSPDYFIALTPLIFSILVLTGQSSPTQAQALDEQEEKQEEQTLDQREQQLEQQLNINRQNERNLEQGGINDEIDHVSPNIEDAPGPGESLGLDDNLPYQPADEEAEMQF